MKTRYIFFVCVSVALLSLSNEVYAARDSETTIVKTINSIALESSLATTTVVGNASVSITAIQFSLEAFTTDITIPKTASRVELTKTAPVRFVLEDRKGNPVRGGTVVARLTPPRGNPVPFTIEQGSRQTFTLLVGYVGGAAKKEEDHRLRILDIPLMAPELETPVLLNPSEVKELTSPFVTYR